MPMVSKPHNSPTGEGAPPHPPVQSIDRMLDIIETLSVCPRGAALTDLAAAVGLHISTVHRMLSALIARGYARKDPETGRYGLTLRLFEIGSRVVGSIDWPAASRPQLERLAMATDETVHLVVRDGDCVVYLYKQSPVENVLYTSSFVGLRNPMYCTGVGKSILAFLPPEEVRSIWERTEPEKFTPRTLTDLDSLYADLEQVRARGWALDEEEHEVGVVCVAAPVFRCDGAPVGAVSVSAPSARMRGRTRLQCAQEVMQSARGISALLGAPTETLQS